MRRDEWVHVILAVNLNAAVDKTLCVPHFHLNGRHYTDSIVAVPGGKGINAARVLHELGADVIVLGFSAGHNGRFIEEGLAAEGIPCHLVRMEGESRLCLTLVDEADGSHTEVNERGPVVSDAALEQFFDVYRRLVDSADTVMLSGSVPPSIPPTVYRTCIELAAGRTVSLDAKSDALRLGLHAHPTVVKPNREELSELMGRSVQSVADALQLLPELHAMGAQEAIVSLGEDGAIWSGPDGRMRAWLHQGKVVSAVGSGDSLLAAFLWGRQQGRSTEECLRLGVAAGLANTWYLGAGFCRREDIEKLRPQVQLEHLRA